MKDLPDRSLCCLNFKLSPFNGFLKIIFLKISLQLHSVQRCFDKLVSLIGSFGLIIDLDDTIECCLRLAQVGKRVNFLPFTGIIILCDGAKTKKNNQKAED